MENSSKKEKTKEAVTKLKKQLITEQEKNREYLNQLKYLQADFENYRKRIEKETHEAIKRSNEKLVSCLIDIMDDFEIAISEGIKTQNKDALIDGIKMVHKKLDNLLAKEGLEPLECVGKPFDPNLHEIIAQVPTDEHQSGTILEEARKGFKYKGKVLRPSVVKIACENSKVKRNE
jgi:molecular chaperone GrpE